GTGNGTLGLNLVDNDSIADGTGNKLGGTGTGNGNFTGQTYAVDKTAPTVSSINRAGGNPTNSASVQYTVTFSESVTGVDTGDFALAGTSASGASISSVTGSGSSDTVTVATDGDGTLGLNLVNDGSIGDAAGNSLASGFTGQTYAVDRTAPTVSSIDRADSSPTNSGSIHFTVTFSESVTGVDAADFALAGTGTTGASISSVTGSGSTYTVTAASGTDGTLGLDLVDNDSIGDA